MSITIGFILIFLLVVIPGLLFQRFYYFGEFSKQFNTKDTVYKSVFYSVIPGILVQILGALIYFSVHQDNFDNILIYSIIQETLAPQENQIMSNDTLKFINNDIYLFLIHNLNIYVLSIFIGYSLTRVVRYFNLDKRFKILRFKNQWYYVFSGEILTFEKFKKMNSVIGEVNGEYDKFKHYPPFADVLIDSSNGEPSLYSGYVIDYDLDSNNIGNLDKIYLIGAHRFRNKKDSDSKKNIHGSRTKVSIKGNVFILSAKDIKNINLTFVPKSLEKDIKIEEKSQTYYRWFYRFLMVLKILVIPIIAFCNYTKFNNSLSVIPNHLEGSNILQKTLLVLCLVQIISIFSPELSYSKDNEKEDTKPYFDYNLKDFGSKLLFLIIISFTYWYFYM